MAPGLDLDCDVAVIGSGFGGSVAALRLTQRGYRVVVLEAGRRLGPADFPKTSWDARRFLWAPALGCTGPQRFTVLRDAIVLSGAGVGGGSLIYGNTLIEPPDRFFEHPAVAAMGGEADLRRYYKLASQMMGVQTNPCLTPVDEALRGVAADLGRPDAFRASPLGVFFGEPGAEVADPYFGGEGPPRAGCTACGGCFLGCRVGAKNTLDRGYLWLAERLGAQVVPETRATRVVPLSEDGAAGYRVETVGSTGVIGRRGAVVAKGVVVAAGVLGTLRLLMEARRRGDLPHLSPAVGEGVRTNAETLVGVRARDRSVDHSKGLAASSSIYPDDHTQVQADRFPAGSDSFAGLSTLLVDGGGRWPRALRWVGEALRRPGDLLRLAWPFGFARQTALLVVMQDRDAKLTLRWERPWFWPFSRALRSWSPDRGDATIPLGQQVARLLAARLDGVPLNLTPEVFFGVPLTAHILGGCLSSDSPEDGVVGPDLQVHGYERLWVCDGSVVPANLGANPALTILSLAERAMARVPPKAGEAMRWLAVDRALGAQGLLARWDDI